MPRAGGITKAANSEARIERKSRSHCGPRFVQLPEQRQRSREPRGGDVGYAKLGVASTILLD
jgi:hypothetical protein